MIFKKTFYLSVVLLAGTVLTACNSVGPQTGIISKEPVVQQQSETLEDSQDNVTVSVTPLNLNQEGGEWRFVVVLETHSVELSVDLLENAVLIDGDGTEYKPLSWEGGAPGGHHRSGTLSFPASDTSKITIKIMNVSGNEERVFEWELK